MIPDDPVYLRKRAEDNRTLAKAIREKGINGTATASLLEEFVKTLGIDPPEEFHSLISEMKAGDETDPETVARTYDFLAEVFETHASLIELNRKR